MNIWDGMISAVRKITLTFEPFDGSELFGVMDELLSDLINAPDEVRNRALYFLDFPSKLIRLESCITSGAVVTVLLKPSELLLDLCAAVRTGNFDFVVIEHGHSFSFVEDGFRELPILSTLEKLPNGRE